MPVLYNEGMAAKPTTYVALLRGINVGGNIILSMAELRACLAGLGLSKVQTYINSGNVLFQTAEPDAQKLEVAIAQALMVSFGLSTPVMVRATKDLQQTIAHFPKSWQTRPDQKCNVIFLSHTIDKPDLI